MSKPFTDQRHRLRQRWNGDDDAMLTFTKLFKTTMLNK